MFKGFCFLAEDEGQIPHLMPQKQAPSQSHREVI